MRDEALMTASEIARLAGVGRAAVGNWRKRHADFPAVAGGTETSPAFRRVEVEEWLRANDKLDDRVDAERLWQRLDAFRWSGRTAAVLAGLGIVLLRGSDDGDLRAWAERRHPDLAPALDGEVERDALALAAGALTVAGDDGGPELFEQLCRRFVDARSGQVHATPPELADLMMTLAGPDTCRDVVDPACGTGGLLMAAARAGVPLVDGQEIEPTAAMLARVRLALAGVEGTVLVGDTLRADAFAGHEGVDVVLCNPPFGLRDWQGDDAFADPRWFLGLPPRGESELAWVQHCLSHLDVQGDAVLVMPPGAASRQSGRRLRAELIRRELLRGVIALPPGSLPETSIAPLIWLLHQGPDEEHHGVAMIDASHHGLAGRRVDWAEVRRTVEEALAAPDAAASDVARRVPAIELLDDEVSLLPQRHLRSAPAPAVDLSVTRDRLLTLLDRARTAVPSVVESMPSTTVRWTPLGDLARSGAVELLSSPSRLEVDDDGDGPRVLTARDVVAGRAPSGRLVTTLEARPSELQVGDVVLPLIAQRPVARVIAEDGVVLGAHVVAVRARPDVLDPWYLAGVLQGEHVLRSSTTGSGSFRISPRSVEVPVAPLSEQEPLANAFRQLAALEVVLASAAEIGTELAATLRAGLADGSLRLADETLSTPPARSTSAPRERNA